MGYTTKVRTIVENSANLEDAAGYNDVNSIIEKAIPNIFNFDFPIFDEKYRTVLCKKILKRYYMREIAHETVGLWKLRLDTMLNEIMPYYNQLYKSALIEFDPFKDVNYKREYDGKRKDDKSHTINTLNDITENHSKDGISKSDYETREIRERDELKRQDNENSNVENYNDIQNDRTVSDNAVNTTSTNDRDSENTQKGKTTSNNKVTNNDQSLYSDTPQGAITGLKNGDFLTNATIKDGTTSANDVTDSTVTTTDKVKDKTTGNVQNMTDTEFIGNQNGERNLTSKGNTEELSNESVQAEIRNNTNNTTNENANSKIKNISNNIGTENLNSTDSYIELITGKMSTDSYSKRLLEFRETFLNIDKMIVDDLNPLFFGLWW